MNEYPYQDGTQNAYPPSGPYNTTDAPGSGQQQPFTGYPPQPDPAYPQPGYAPPQPYYVPPNAPGMYAPQQAGYIGVAGVPTQANGPGIASLVLGIVGIITFWFPFVGLAVSIVGLALATVGMKRIQGKGIAIAGLVLTIIALVLSGCITVAYLVGSFHPYYY
jgi:hypothetical protein